MFVNGREELKFKTKIDQIINKNLCLGKLSRYWTKDQSTKNFFIRKYLRFCCRL